MSKSEYSLVTLGDILPLYYKRLFPHSLFYRWLSYGDPLTFAKREISFTLLNEVEVYIRFQFFDTLEMFKMELFRKCPGKIDLGGIYPKKPVDRKNASQLKPFEKEIVFDLDLSDYDDVRTCCSKTDVCIKCWKFMVIACHILDQGLDNDFGYNHRLWIFSGRRGIHCWVCDKAARTLTPKERKIVAQFLQIANKSGQYAGKKISLPGKKLHSTIVRAISIIDKHFTDIVEGQDILGTDERLNNFLYMIDQDLRPLFQLPMKLGKTSLERWNIFETTFAQMLEDGKITEDLNHLKEEIKLSYCYPRLDINVSKGMNHLLKSPFSIHPKTGKISIPFDAKMIEDFDPTKVPTIEDLIHDMDNYGLSLMESETGTVPKLKDYEKTRLLEPINIFEEFLKSLEVENQKNPLPV